MLKKLSGIFAIIVSHFAIALGDANITEINEITAVKDYLKPDSVIFLNVGDTLFSPSSMLADNQWRRYFVERAQKLLPESEAARLIDKVKAIIVEQIPKLPPEEITPKFIQELQSKKIPVLGFTQRCISTSYAPNNGQITSQHLLRMNIDLNKTMTYFFLPEYIHREHAFKFGMLFTNKNPAGPGIVELLNLSGKKVSHVIVVDNEVEPLEEVVTTLKGNGIESQGLRYARLDAFKRTFDPVLGTIEFLYFLDRQMLLSDEQAQQIKRENPSIDYEALLDAWIRTK